MRTWLTAVLLVCITTSWLPQVEATACATICYTTELTGFGSGGTAGCSCSGSGATRTGSDGCQCGQCYLQQSGTVIGYAISSDGTCAFGTDCGDCDYSSDASGSSTSASASASSSSTTPTPTPSTGSTSTDAPTTSSPAASDPSSSTSSASSAPTVASNAGSGTTAGSSSTSNSGDNAGGTAGSGASTSSSSGGLATWQIALIICCGVLVFTVAVVSVLSCYCKARNRLYENEDAQADASYYHQPYPGARGDIMIGDGAGAAAAAGAATPSLFAQAPSSSRSQQRRSGSFTNDLKPLYSNSSQTNNPDRIGLGLAPVHARSSSGDLAGNYSNERRPSASNRSVGRRPSLEQQYQPRDPDSFAVEL